MNRVFYILILIVFLACSSLVVAQRDPEVGPAIRTSRPTRKAPIGNTRAQNRGNGVLFVLTDPLNAQVAIKSGSKTISQGRSENGQFRTELPPGNYDIEATSQHHQPFTVKASLQPGGLKIVEADLISTVGSVLIGLGSVDTDANVFVDGRKAAAVVKKEENQIEIENLSIGPHTLRITHPTIVDWEKTVKVEGGSRLPVNPRFTPAIVNLTIRSEPGAEVSVDGTYRGKVEPNGTLKIFNTLRPGERVIQVTKNEFQTASVTRNFSVGDATVEIKLDRVVFSPPFADSFISGAGLWDLPRTWRITPGKLLTKGAGAELSLGLVRNSNYADFKMEFDVSFANGKGATWIVRARDKKNFYLFQLMGPQGSAPNTFHSFIYENGEPRYLKPAEFLALNLSNPKDSFHITIEARGPSIKHFIEIASSPQAGGRQPLSVLSDKMFSHGALGFGSKDNEEFTVFTVEVTPTK